MTGNGSCEDCPWPGGFNASTGNVSAFWDQGICNLTCREDFFKDASTDGVCKPCTTILNGTCEVGQKWEGCSATQNERCEACDTIRKGFYYRNERYVAGPRECSTECVPEHYRSQDTQDCLPCTRYQDILERYSADVVPGLAPLYHRYQPCSATGDLQVVPCDVTDTSDITNHAPSLAADCDRTCHPGTHRIPVNVTGAPTGSLHTSYTWTKTECVSCDPVVDAHNQTIYPPAYSVDVDCVVYCNSTQGYYDRTNRSGPGVTASRTCVSCLGRCVNGTYPTGPTCEECIPCVHAHPGSNWVFTSAGTVDDPASCEDGCTAGMFRDFDQCKPHSNITCATGQFLVVGTDIRDAFCSPCRDCTGQRLSRACSHTADATCDRCANSSDTQAGITWRHDNCTIACQGGWVLNTRTTRCEYCDGILCPVGFAAPPDRHNCTHCVACTDLPMNAMYMAAGLCFWTCPDGLFYNDTSNACTARTSVEPVADVGSTVTACEPGHKLKMKSYTATQCVECDVLTPVEDTAWKWSTLGAECSWHCLSDTPFKYIRSSTHVECLSWHDYQIKALRDTLFEQTLTLPEWTHTSDAVPTIPSLMPLFSAACAAALVFSLCGV